MPAKPGRRTDAEVVAAVHAAVVEEVVDVGMGKLTMDGIAQRAGIAKTSLYRRWDNPQAVLLDAARGGFPHDNAEPVLTGDLRCDLIEALRLMVAWMATPTAQVTGMILAERARYPELAEAVYRDVFEPKGGRFTTAVLQHYAESGRIDPVVITPVVLDIGEALVLKYLLDAGSLPDDSTLVDIVDQVLLPAVDRRDRPAPLR
ncbi:TetR/AcrR family transcriptional regulator [Nocardia carnea]|uniref:TetR/AcrR family transcriptional regulator n=1 Tax=Nocardia carnea TaxID=37328 RepID=UPI0024543220|nr:TetR/AcrR family transcriptional regulator [Nocardia carnea]